MWPKEPARSLGPVTISLKPGTSLQGRFKVLQGCFIVTLERSRVSRGLPRRDASSASGGLEHDMGWRDAL